MDERLVWLTIVSARSQHPDIRASSVAEVATYADRMVEEYRLRFEKKFEQTPARPPASRVKERKPPEVPLPEIATPPADFAATERAPLGPPERFPDLQVQLFKPTTGL